MNRAENKKKTQQQGQGDVIVFYLPRVSFVLRSLLLPYNLYNSLQVALAKRARKEKKKSLNENKGTIIGHEDDLLQIIKAEQEQQRVFIEASRRRKNKAEKCVKINHKPRALFGYSFCQTSGWRLMSERNSKLVQTRVIVFLLRGCGCAIKSNFRLSPSESTLPQVD